MRRPRTNAAVTTLRWGGLGLTTFPQERVMNGTYDIDILIHCSFNKEKVITIITLRACYLWSELAYTSHEA